MSVFRRLKRLWVMSKEPRVGELDLNRLQSTWPDTNEALVPPPTVAEEVVVLKPRGAATVVQDDPLDIFPNNEPDRGTEEAND